MSHSSDARIKSAFYIKLGRVFGLRWKLRVLALKLEEIETKLAEKRRGTRTDLVPILALSDFGKVRDKIAKSAGISHGSIDKVKKIELPSPAVTIRSSVVATPARTLSTLLASPGLTVRSRFSNTPVEGLPRLSIARCL